MSVYDLLTRDNRGAVVEAIKIHYPKFSKSLMSECINGRDYGIDLLPEAKRILVETVEFWGCKPRKADKRKKTHHLHVRLSDEMFYMFEQHINLKGYTTVQAYLEQLILRDIKRNAAVSAKNDSASKNINNTFNYTRTEGKCQCETKA